MNREQAKKILPIIQAFVKGKTIEFRERGCTLWAESGSSDKVRGIPTQISTIHDRKRTVCP